MNAEAPPSNDKPKPCGDCDLGAIEDLACSAKRFQKQADVAKESLEKIPGYQTQFGTARSDYQAARDAVQADVAAAKKQLEDVLGQLKCRLDDDKEHCLEEALDKVIAAIRECAGVPGCCAGPCEFDADPGDDTAAALSGRIEQYRRDVKKSMDCFETLIAEQTELKTRATKIKADVAAIATDLAADVPGKDWARLYARALVAQWQLRPAQLWKGFPTVNDYVDCLCTALTCALKGWEAIAILEGIKAEMDCKAEAAAAACVKKQQDIVGEVMREYVCCCPPDDDNGDYPPKDKDDCGNHKHDHGQADYEKTSSV
jgi:hypothetical protein